MTEHPDKPRKMTEEETVADVAFASKSSRARIVPGDMIGPFKVIRELGEGGFGAVYLCEQSEPVKRQVAIKIIKPGMDSESIIARFEAERQALAMMSHSSIAKVFEAGTTPEGRLYFVMEYVKGVPINEYCDKNKLDTNARLNLFAKVCDGVHHAHQKGIIHRDLKPGNILVTIADRREPQPKIIDFGIAKATNQQLTEKEIFTQVGQMIGTPEYMSPEQAEMSSEDIDTRTDVYSLGVVLYELLSGRLPFDPKSLRSKGYAEIQRIIREDDPPKPSTNLTTVGDAGSRIAEQRRTSLGSLSTLLRQELEWIPLKALRKDRTERYASADSFGQDVRRYLSGEPLEAGPETSIYRLKKLVRRNRGPFIAAGLIALSLLGGIIASGIFAVEANAQRARAEDRMQRLQSLVVELSGPINDSVKNLEGGMQVRQQMLSAGMRQLDLIRSEAEASGDPELLNTVGRTLLSFGDLIGGPRVASGGDREQARRHY
ncbi:MAG: serine/threonine protein kinase, partial [Phycisphaerales bacterium]|nr:serine/threonine protein kinase [Phycisphaerales bacterium]